MDCDGQHEPARIPVLLEAHRRRDIVSGSRYLRDFRQDTPAPTDRRFINATITREINARYGLNLTDAFCGFKAYRREALEKLHITETRLGHAAAALGAGGAAGAAGEGDRRAAALPRPEPRVRRRDERPRPSGWPTTAACSPRPSTTCCPACPRTACACPELC